MEKREERRDTTKGGKKFGEVYVYQKWSGLIHPDVDTDGPAGRLKPYRERADCRIASAPFWGFALARFICRLNRLECETECMAAPIAAMSSV